MKLIDLVLLGGNIWASSGREEALAIKGDRIVAVGSNERIKAMAADAKKVHLKGKTVLPGFIDSHTHLVSTGLKQTFYLDLSKATSLKDVLELVEAEARRKSEGEWIVGWGWDESRWPKQRYITKDDLDKVAPKNPTALIRVDGHLVSISSLALKMSKVKVTEATGLLREHTAWSFLEEIEPDIDTLKEAIRAGVKLCHQLGITSVHDIVKPSFVRAYSELKSKGELKLRVYLNYKVEYLKDLISLGLSSGFGDDVLKIGAIKIFADGSIGARNAAFFESYADHQGHGELNYTLLELKGLIKGAQDFQVMVHAIGDRGIETTLKAFSNAKLNRWRIEHFELPTEKHLRIAAKLGIIASMQPNFLKWAEKGGLYERRLGRRASRINPLREVLDHGIILAFGSDGMPMGPLYGIFLAVNAPNDCQRLKVEEAIRCYTEGGAYASFEEDIKGSIEEGKLADLVVLSHDPLTTDIKAIKVEQVWWGGRRVFKNEDRDVY